MKHCLFLLLLVVFAQPLYALSLEEAQEDYLFGNYQTAIAKAERLKEDSETLYFLAQVNIKLGLFEPARVYLVRNLEVFPHSRLYDKSLVKLADTYFLEQDYQYAKEIYEEVLDAHPDSGYLALIYLRLAQIASKNGNWQEKDKYLKIIRSKYPKASEMKYVDILEESGNFFAVQVGAFGTEKNALVLQQELAKSGYDAYTLSDRKADLTLYKVRVGKYREREEVEKVFTDLQAKGYPARIYP